MNQVEDYLSLLKKYEREYKMSAELLSEVVFNIEYLEGLLQQNIKTVNIHKESSLDDLIDEIEETINID